MNFNVPLAVLLLHLLPNGKQASKKNILKLALYDGPSENLRPLYNSNVAKVYIVKWLQIVISTAISSSSVVAKIFNKMVCQKQDF